MDNKIRVNSGIVVEVNDAGETITINVEDQMFIQKFYGLIEQLEEIVTGIENKKDEKLDYNQALTFLIAETTKIMDGIDSLFGVGACAKIFGDIVPSAFVLADFFNQLLPITERYASEREKKISEKYNRDRKGGKR